MMTSVQTNTVDAREIPVDWKVSKIVEIADCLDNLRIPLNITQRANMKGEYPYCGANGVVDYVNDYHIDDDVILMAEDGGYFDEYETRPIAYRMTGKIWVNNHAHILKSKEFFDSGFLFYSLVHKNILPFLASGTRAKLNKSEMNKIEVCHPPIKEQEAIAEVLRDADALVEELEKLIAKKRLLKQGMIQELLTGKRCLPGFSGKWKEFSFGKVVEIRNRKEQTYSNPIAARCVELEQIEQNTGRIDSFSDARDRHSIKYVFQKNDVLFGRLRPYLRKFWRANCNGVCSTEIWPLIPREDKIDPLFLFQIVQADKFIEAANSSYGTHMPRSDWQALTGYKVMLPIDAAEQVAVGALLNDMDEELAALETKLAKVRWIKRGMMQELLTGRIRLL